MLEVEHTVLQRSFGINRLVNQVERLDTAFIDIHQTFAPGSDGIVEGIGLLLSGLRTMVVRIVTYLNLLDIDNVTTSRLNPQVALCFIGCALGFHHHLLPFARLDSPLTVISGSSVNFVTREIYKESSFPFNICIEGNRIFGERVHLEAFNDADF